MTRVERSLPPFFPLFFRVPAAETPRQRVYRLLFPAEASTPFHKPRREAGPPPPLLFLFPPRPLFLDLQLASFHPFLSASAGAKVRSLLGAAILG